MRTGRGRCPGRRVPGLRSVLSAGLSVALLACGSASPGTPSPAMASEWASEAERWVDAWHAAGREGQANRLSFLTTDVVLEDRLGGREIRGRSDVTQARVDAAGPVDASRPLLMFLSADAVMDQTLWVYSGPVDWLDRLEMDGSAVARIVTGGSVATAPDRATGTADVEAVDDLADRYVGLWNGEGPAAAGTLYTLGVTIEDSLLGVSLRGSDAIADSVGSGLWPDLPPAAILSLDGRADTGLLPLLSPPRGRAVDISPSLSPLAFDEVRIVLQTDDGSGCPGALVAELGWDGERIAWERRYHDVASTRRCLDPVHLEPGWWEGITVPDPVRVEETAPMVWSERDVTVRIVNGSPAATRFVRWGLARFAAAGLPLPRVDSVTFLSCESRCRGYHGLFEGADGEVAITLCCTAGEICVDDVCSTWYPAPRHVLLHELAHAWTEQYLTEQDKQRFLAFEGLDAWSDFSDPWPERGMERAAEAVAFALSATPASACAPGGPGPRYLEGFRLLTDREPLASCSDVTAEEATGDPASHSRDWSLIADDCGGGPVGCCEDGSTGLWRPSPASSGASHAPARSRAG